jgi:hypothetical protein
MFHTIAHLLSGQEVERESRIQYRIIEQNNLPVFANNCYQRKLQWSEAREAQLVYQELSQAPTRRLVTIP